MDDLQLPSGRYLSCAIDVQADNFGQTKALLMRNRIFASRGGVVPSVLSFGANNDMRERRETLLERGLLAHGVDLLNIFEHYQDTDWPGDTPTGAPLADLSCLVSKETTLSDGTPFRRYHRMPDGSTLYDYLRPDGSTFLRMPAFVFRMADTWPTSVLRVSRSGEVVGEHDSPSGWYRRWLQEMTAGHERSFVFLDSRFLAPFLAPIEDPSVHLVYLLHNIHLAAPHRWDSVTGDVHEQLLDLAGDFDAFVTLTDRQRDDIAQRCGRLSNQFVVPNPVDLPDEPDHVQRDPNQITVMARLVTQKRLRQAITAMRDVVAEFPQAHLDIFGDGPRMDSLRTAIARDGLGASVTLKGHDPRAREALWRSSAFVMTSAYEGYPLSTLESMSQGCPVVSYDIKYGPQEQIRDGEDGFLVPSGDVKALADRIKRLVGDPALVARMGAAARLAASHHGHDRFLADWLKVLQGTVDLKAARTTIDHADLEVNELTIGGSAVPGRPGRAVPGVFADRRRFTFRGRLTVRGHSGTARLEDAEVTLAACHRPSSAVVSVPLEVSFADGVFSLSASARLADLYPAGGDRDGRAHLRLRVVWNNSMWETRLRRPAVSPTGVEVSFAEDGELSLTLA